MSYTGKAIDLSKYEKYGKKVELSKVELSNIKDIEDSIKIVDALSKNANEIKSDSKEADSLFAKAFSLQDRIRKNYLDTKKEIEKTEKKLNSGFNQLNKAAKDLGLDVKNIPVYKEYLNAKNNLGDMGKMIQDSWSTIFKYEK